MKAAAPRCFVYQFGVLTNNWYKLEVA